MNKKVIFILVVFMLSFVYLHQKINFYIEAYTLSDDFKSYKDLIDQRDSLRYNLYDKVSLSAVNQWVDRNEFQLPGKERILAFNISNSGAMEGNKDRTAGTSLIAYLNHRLFRLPVETEALAEEKNISR